MTSLSRLQERAFVDPLAPPLLDNYKPKRYPECGCQVIRDQTKEPLLRTSESSVASTDDQGSDPESEQKPERESRPRMPANICGARDELEKNAPLMCSNHRKMAILECYSPSMPTWLQQIRSLELSETQVYETVYSLYATRKKIRKKHPDSDSCDEQEKSVREVLKQLAEYADSPLKLEAALSDSFGSYPEKKKKKKKHRKRARSSKAMERGSDSSSSDEEPVPRKNVGKQSAGGKNSGAAGGQKGPKQDAGKVMATKFSARQAARKKQAIAAPEAKDSSDEEDPDEQQEEPIVKGPGKRAADEPEAEAEAEAEPEAEAAVAGPSKAASGGRRRKKSACRKSKKHHK